MNEKFNKSKLNALNHKILDFYKESEFYDVNYLNRQLLSGEKKYLRRDLLLQLGCYVVLKLELSTKSNEDIFESVKEIFKSASFHIPSNFTFDDFSGLSSLKVRPYDLQILSLSLKETLDLPLNDFNRALKEIFTNNNTLDGTFFFGLVKALSNSKDTLDLPEHQKYIAFADSEWRQPN